MNKFMTAVLGLMLTCSVWAEVSSPDTQQQADNFEDQIDRVVFIDHNLNRREISAMWFDRDVVKLTVERRGSQVTQTGTLKAWAVLKNRTDYDLQVEGRVIFLDDNSIPLDDMTAWKRMYIPANGLGTYRDSSLSFSARHFIIELREGR